MCKKVQTLFKGHKSLLLEFNKLIPPTYQTAVEIRPHYQEAIEYMRQVKVETKDNPLVYSEFIQILKKYQDKVMTIEQVNSSVRVIMSGYPNLIDNFKAFLPNYNEESSFSESESEIIQKPNKIKSPAQTYPHDKVLIEVISEPILKQETFFFKRLKKVMDLNSLPKSDFYTELMKTFELYIKCIITRTELANIVEPLFKLNNFQSFINPSYQSRRVLKDENRDLVSFIQAQLKEMFEVFTQIASTRESGRRKIAWFFKPLGDFDTAKSRKYGHSYLEIQRPRILKSQPSPEINRQWVSVTTGSEDVSFRNFRKNIFEDALFKCEDERFETEITMQTALYTLRMLERALDDSSSLSLDEQKFFQLNEKIFTKLRLKPIFSIYSEHAPKIIEMLKINPIKSLPVVIARIKSKIDNWKKNTKSESEKLWKETIEKNFFKSLDYRTFYFKQHEKRMMNPKSFLTEAKARYSIKQEVKELMRKYLMKEMAQPNFEFIGGSRNTLFFNSFAGLGSGVVHKISEKFADPVLQEFFELEKTQNPSGLNDFCVLPHFRLLLSCSSVLVDTIRLLTIGIDKLNLPDTCKMDRWISAIFGDFMGIKLTLDITQHKVEEFFDGSFNQEIEKKKEKEKRIHNSQNYTKRWIINESYSGIEITDDSISENLQETMILVKEDFYGYLPLLKNNQILYGGFSLFCFLRCFYEVYERLLKVKVILSNTGVDYEYKKIEYGDYEFSQLTEEKYAKFIKSVLLLIKGQLEPSKFEEQCRSTLGNDSYIFFSFEKLVNCAARSLLSLTTDEIGSKFLGLFSKYLKVNKNEEMYLTDCCNISPLAPIFRIHWSSEFGVISVTYIESSFDKLNEQGIKNAQNYKNYFILDKNKNLESEETKIFISRIKFFYGQNGKNLPNEVFSFSQIKKVMVENSRKFFYLCGYEDFILNSYFYCNYNVLECEGESFLCKDKNSLFQKISEVSEKNFAEFRNLWISKA